MKRHFIYSLLILLVLTFFVAGGAATDSEEVIAIKGKTVYTAAGPPITDGVVIVRNGKIVQVGKGLSIPSGAKVYQAEVVMPGLIEAHGHFAMSALGGDSDVNEATDPSTPYARASDAINIEDPHFRYPLSGGVTTIVSRPGSANVFGGLSVALKIKTGSLKDMIIKDPCDLKMAMEGNPIGVYGSRGRMPKTMMGVYYIARKDFLEAQNYLKQWEKYEKEKETNPEAKPPKRDLNLEPLVMALKGEIPVHIHTAKANEVDAALRLFDEFHLDGSYAHAYWGYLIADKLAKRKEVLVLGPEMFFHYFGEKGVKNSSAILAKKGAKIAVQTDSGSYGIKYLRNIAALCMRYGLPLEEAIKSVTINAADAVNLEGRIGSLQPGKDADIVIMDGNPFEVVTTVEKVFVDGKLEFSNKEKLHTLKDLTLAPPVVSSDAVKLRHGKSSQIAIVGGTILTITKGIIPDGVVLIEDGKIKGVGKDLSIPSGSTVIEAKGKVVMPGLVAASSSLGLFSDWKRYTHTDEATNPVLPAMEVIHAIDPFFPTVYDMMSSGVTTANVTPGGSNVFGGRGAVIKTSGTHIDELLVKEHSIMMGSYGESAKRTYGRQGRLPSTRMGIAYLMRDNLLKAREYKEKLAEATAEEKMPRRDLQLEALVPVIEGKLPLMVRIHRKSDILNLLNIADKFGIKLIIEGGTDTYKVADQLAKRNIPVVITSLRGYYATPETADFRPDLPALLEKAGVKVGFRLDDARWPINSLGHQDGNLLLNAALAFKNGMSEMGAIRSITIDPAEMLGIAEQVGSLEPGKDADILILAGHPFLIKAVPEMVIINGKIIFQPERD